MDDNGRKGLIELVEMVWSGKIDINMVEMEWNESNRKWYFTR